VFVLPTLLIPLVLGLALHRLYQIPRGLWRGELRLPGRQRALLHVATITAYGVLLCCTVALVGALVHVFLVADDRLSAYWKLALYMAAYPLVYMGVAWIFYYGLKPPSRD
jgi:hypothetical protein